MNGSLSDEPSIPNDDSRLLHLLTCPVCRSWAIGRLLGKSAGDGVDPDETRVDYDEMFKSLEERAPELIERSRSRRAEDEQLLAEILRTPPGSRFRRIRGARFRSPGLLELLLERSHAHQLTDPRLAGELAVLATRLATLLDGDFSGPALARALCLDASSCRLLGDWKGAEERIGRAAPFLTESTDRAFYW